MADNGEPRHCARSGGFHLRRFAAPFGGTIAKPLSYGQVDGFVRNPTSPAARHYTTSCPPPPSRCCAVPRPTTPSTRPPRHTPLAGGHLHVLYDVVLPSHASSRRRPASGPLPRLSNIRIRCCPPRHSSSNDALPASATPHLASAPPPASSATSSFDGTLPAAVVRLQMVSSFIHMKI